MAGEDGSGEDWQALAREQSDRLVVEQGGVGIARVRRAKRPKHNKVHERVSSATDNFHGPFCLGEQHSAPTTPGPGD